MAAATTLATAGVIFPVLLAVRYGGPAGRTRVLTMISWSPFSSRAALGSSGASTVAPRSTAMTAPPAARATSESGLTAVSLSVPAPETRLGDKSA
jgi:hypothetical protein